MNIKVATKILLMTFLVLVSGAASAGGGWVKSKGQGYYKFGQSLVTSQGYFGSESIFYSTLSSSLYTTSLYAEHGIGEGVSIEGYLPIFIRHSVTGNAFEDGTDVAYDDAASGIGDANIGLRVSILKQDRLALSGTFTLSLPLGSPTLGDQGNLFTGDGEFNQILRMDLSTPFGGKKVGGYATVYGAFNNRSGAFSNELLYGGEVGFSFLQSKLWLIGRYNAIYAARPTLSEVDQPVNALTSSGSFSTYMVEASFMMSKKVGLSVSYTGSISGDILLVAPIYSGGIFLNIN